jgi:metal-responsive CopG/Arc/MetJ family transcriptional regulator
VKRVHIALDEKLLPAADRAAHALEINRSMLVRQALRAHLARLERQAREEIDEAGYERVQDELHRDPEWEEVAAWPQECKRRPLHFRRRTVTS